jgi:hypothetical protein
MFGNADAKESAAARLLKRKVSLWTVLAVVVVLLVAMGMVWQAAVGDAERRIELERQELTRTLKAEMTAAEARNREALVQQSEQAHLLFGSALAWAVRSALVQNKLREVDQYLAELMKNDRIELALLADAKGKVVASTDRQFIGKSFSRHFAPALLNTDKISLRANGSDIRLVVPIRGLTVRLGTVLVVYAGRPVR